jgi:hypothetical protein
VLTHLRAAIYFDGFLPASKLAERYLRTIRASKQLQLYHAANSKAVPSPSTSEVGWEDLPLLDARSATSNHHRMLPSPGFLVPAVIEALAASERYASVVHVVPGEADEYCAHHVRRCSTGGTVLTADSDLLLYDLGPLGAVMWLGDLELRQEAGGRAQILAPSFSPSSIERRLSLPMVNGLIRFAFEGLHAPARSVQSLVAMTNLEGSASNPGEPDFEQFAERYREAHVVMADPVAVPQRAADASIRMLDTRISELVQQCNINHPEFPLRDLQSPGSVHSVQMFLPLLLDDPTRSSAWDSSQAIRKLSYFILQEATSLAPLAVREIKRLHVVPRESIGELVTTTLTDLRQFLHDLQDIRESTSDNLLLWTVLAIQHDINSTLDAGRTSFGSLVDVRKVAMDQTSAILQWDLLHLFAQIIGTMYSCRILVQVMHHCAGHVKDELLEVIQELQKLLSCLPSLAEFPSHATLLLVLPTIKTAGGIDCLKHMFKSNKIVSEQLAAVDVPLRTERTSRKAKVSRPSTMIKLKAKLRQETKNPFELLASSRE